MIEEKTITIVCATVGCETILKDVPVKLIDQMCYCSRCRDIRNYCEVIGR